MIQNRQSSQFPEGVAEETSRFRFLRHLFFRRLVILLVLILVVFFIARLFYSNRTLTTNSEKWQSVFLNNGQVYFGHLKEFKDDYVELANVYYLRATQALQPPASSTPMPSFELVKLGGELHGPEDAIYFVKSSILFWEDMKDNSQVVQAINNFQQNLKQ